MGRSYGTPEVDEDDLAAELDALGDEIGEIQEVRYKKLLLCLFSFSEQ